MPDAKPDARMRRELSHGVRDSLVIIERRHQFHEVRRSGSSRSEPVPGKWTSRSGVRGALGSFHRDWKEGALQGAYGSDLRRMEKLEHGGTIRPKGQFLAIPTRAAPKEVWPRYVPDLFFVPRHGGASGFLARKTGSGIQVMYSLVRSVTLPPRPTLENAEKNSAKDVDKRMLDALDVGMWER